MELIETYNKYPDALKRQLRTISTKLGVSKRVEDYYHHMLDEIKKKNNIKFDNNQKKIIYRLAILTVVKPFELMSSEFFPYVYCYKEDSDQKIKFTELIKEGKHARVLKGKDDRNKTVIVKYYTSEKRDTCFEIGVYEELKKSGMKLPSFDTSYHFWGYRVLSMEKLDKLNAKDDEFELALQILDQLKHLHKFGVHSDIKPLNIMKKRNYKTKKTIYYLIDFGGISYERLDHGYRRWIWSPNWTSQKSHQKNQVTTMKYDFIELGYTMKHLQNLKNKNSKDACRSGFKGKLSKYMEFVQSINDENIPDDIHDQIINFIKKMNN